MLGSYRSCRGPRARPIQARLPRNERGHIRNPEQTFPEMFGAMDRDQHEFVFHRKGGNLVGIEAHVSLPRKKVFDGKSAGKIAKGKIVVQFDEQISVRLREK